MPVLNYLADTNAVSDVIRGEPSVVAWFDDHLGQVALSTITLAQLRRRIELRPHGKRRRELERDFQFILQDFAGAILVFDEAAAFEWGRLMAATKDHPLSFDDSLIAAIGHSVGLKIVTRNTKDFLASHSVNPWTGEEHTPSI